MDCKQKIDELKEIIFTRLSPLIDNDYVLWDLPYHGNIGDTLIWEGERCFLKSLPYRCLDTASAATCTFPKLSKDTVILLHGGGNFGDLWRFFHEFKLKVIQRYPENKIVILPQSVWYDNPGLIDKDARILSQHANMYICARDQWSYDFMKRHFPTNNVLLVPDMAFYISDSILNLYRSGAVSGHTLYLKRMDKEITAVTPESMVRVDIHDWPTVEQEPKRLWWLWKFSGVARRLHSAVMYNMLNQSANRLIKDFNVKKGCEFLAPYSNIITTRLHCMILGILLYKPILYIDNKTQKLSAFVETWLNDLDRVKPFDV